MVLKVPSGVVSNVPVQVIFYATSASAIGSGASATSASFPRLYIHAGANSRIEIRQSILCGDYSLATKLSPAIITDATSSLDLSNYTLNGEDDNQPLLSIGGQNSDSSPKPGFSTSASVFIAGNTRVILDENATVYHTYHQELSGQ